MELRVTITVLLEPLEAEARTIREEWAVLPSPLGSKG